MAVSSHADFIWKRTISQHVLPSAYVYGYALERLALSISTTVTFLLLALSFSTFYKRRDDIANHDIKRSFTSSIHPDLRVPRVLPRIRPYSHPSRHCLHYHNHHNPHSAVAEVDLFHPDIH